MRVFEGEKVPIKSWCMEPEEGALAQARNLAALPFVYKWVSLMPDTHQGYGMPIGGVIATEKVVIPNAVGVDIGCGMCAVKTPWKVGEINHSILIETIMGKIREVVPVGFNKHEVKQDISFMPNADILPNAAIIHKEFSNAQISIGTLGGGNHFIEIQKDEEDNVWVMIHSGSRNLGYKVAKHYNELAIALTGKWYSYVPKKWELAFLPLDTKEGKDYLAEMAYCVDFALANRKLMMTRVAGIFNKVINHKKIDLSGMINIAHNYARMENHYGKNVMVHRKGATSAQEGLVGIIPGSQGTSSYIVKGKGNIESFTSCSHGAGRKMGRKQAIRELNLEEEQKKLDDQDIVHSIRNVEDLDEASGAYKDIDTVMEEQKDLVTVLAKLSPLAVIKG